MSAKIPVNRVKISKPEKPGKETIYIDIDDEITSIIDKVEAAKSKIVALVLPKRANALQSVVNMRLLKRSSDKASKSLVLVTSEAALLPLAGAAGIHVAKNLQSAPEIPPSPLDKAKAGPDEPEDAEELTDEDKPSKIDYKRSIGELAAAHEADDAITLDEPGDELPEPKEPKSSAGPKAISRKLNVPNFERFRLMLFGGIFLFIALIVFIILAIFVLPKGTIAITTTSLPISANLTLNASDKFTTLDEKANNIPAVLKASKQTSNQTANATGQKNLGDKAKGTVTVSNCTNSAITVPAGSGVSSGGLTFITQNSINLDSGNFTSGGACKSSGSHVGSVSVTAQSGGTKYNIGPSSFSVAGFSSSVTGQSSGSMSGGTDNIVTVVTQGDIDAAKAKVTSASTDDFTKKLEKQLSDQGLYVLTSTLKISDPAVTATPGVDQQASTATVNIEITYSVLAVKKDDLRKVITDTLNEQVDKTKQKISNDDVLNDVSVSVQNQTAPAAAILSVNEDTTAVPIIDVAQVKKLAAGKKSGDIKTTISAWPGVKKVDVKFSPFWVSKAPGAGKITVKLLQTKD
ncbi:hypothetical protein KW789_01060 [Candidatus Saccharibacteria bacterium]|nr:hypothetical protein [Candidatus Saccharibacteria bacterium]